VDPVPSRLSRMDLRSLAEKVIGRSRYAKSNVALLKRGELMPTGAISGLCNSLYHTGFEYENPLLVVKPVSFFPRLCSAKGLIL
jgi:hypothetical protein